MERLVTYEPITITVTDALKLGGIGRNTLYKLIGRGEIKSTTIGRRRLIDYASLKERLTRVDFRHD